MICIDLFRDWKNLRLLFYSRQECKVRSTGIWWSTFSRFPFLTSAVFVLLFIRYMFQWCGNSGLSKPLRKHDLIYWLYVSHSSDLQGFNVVWRRSHIAQVSCRFITSNTKGSREVILVGHLGQDDAHYRFWLLEQRSPGGKHAIII
jgi:hypothetical protein